MKIKLALSLLIAALIALAPMQEALVPAQAETEVVQEAVAASDAGKDEAQAADAQEEGTVYYAKKTIKLFKAKKTSSKVLDKIDKGEAVTVLTYEKKWCSVTYMGQEGFVKTSGLTQTRPDPTHKPDPTPTPAPEKGSPTVPASQASTHYTGTEVEVVLPAEDIISAFVLDYSLLGGGYFNRVNNLVASNIDSLLQQVPVIPTALNEYEDILKAVCSDLASGATVELMGAQLNAKKTKTTNIFTDKNSVLSAASLTSDEDGDRVFDFGTFTVRSVGRGTYYMQLAIPLSSAPKLKALYGGKEIVVNYPIKVVKSSGGGGGGGGGGEKQQPVARLIVESVRTEPELPTAGDTFDIIASLRNTSETLYLRNLQITYTSDEDALAPVDGTNVIYVDSIDAGANYDLRLTVKSKPDIEASSARLELSAEFEDKKLNALSASQTLVIPIQQVQRIQLDKPTLPTGTTMAGDSYTVKMGVFNTGKTVLYNVTVKGTPDDPEKVATGTSYYIGNMDPGSSKTAELEFIPLEAGTFGATLDVTYETVDGKQTTETQTISFTAEEEAIYDYNEDDSYIDEPIDVPQAPTVSEVLAKLPWQVYALAGALLLIVIVWIGIAAHRRRLRALEDDEMD